MNPPHILLLNCTIKATPELSEIETLWNCVAPLYGQQHCSIQQVRLVDHLLVDQPVVDPQPTAQAEPLHLGDTLAKADILILGIPIQQGTPTPVYIQLLEHLRQLSPTHCHPLTEPSPLYSTVLGLIALGDTSGCQDCLARISYDWGQLGCVNPPQNNVAWWPAIDSELGFSAAGGKYSLAVNRSARQLVANSLALANLLRQAPLPTHLRDIDAQVRAIAQAAQPPTVSLLTPKTISETDSESNSIAPRHVSKRIWTLMQAGQQRGFTFQALDLGEKIFRAERGGKGFTYKVYPGYFSCRSQYADYPAAQTKSCKLAMLTQQGLPVPTSYGTFETLAELPWAQLQYPLVAKPDSGSLSQNVFANLQTPEQLKAAAGAIAATGGMIKLEAHIPGRDYRILIIDHHYAGCVERRPANVVGDGHQTILELFQQRNQEPGRGDRDEQHTTLHQLVFDDTSRQLLQHAGYSLETVLPAGEIFYVQTKIPAALGSDYVDCTDALHQSIVQTCIQAADAFPSLIVGFDLITPNITQPLSQTGGAFNEYNFVPYVDLHEHCNIGQPRPVCRLIWDYIEAHATEILTADFKPF
ncbi:MAG: hypothetical protein AAGG51_22285 [Cyanobacteria bacterium P01_G01_bin.54]